MTTLMDLWLEAALEADALRAQLGYLERAWLRAEADADYWYYQANNSQKHERTQTIPILARAVERGGASSAHRPA